MDATITRRDVLKGLAGAAGLVILPTVAGACGATYASQAPNSLATAASTALVPSAVPQPSSAPVAALTLATAFPGGFGNVVDAFTAKTGIGVKVRTVDAASFQDQIVPYLMGSPEDVISWGAGRSRSLVAEGLLQPIDDVWAAAEPNMPTPIKTMATWSGHQYCMPIAAYVWGVFHRKDVFAQHGYRAPTSWAGFVDLARRMEHDGLTPIAMANAELFEAMGTFDILDLRLNGAQFHLDLLAGKERWTDPRVRDVFVHWREILPFTQTGSASRSFTDAIQAVVDKNAGMYLMGSGIMLSNVDAAEVPALDMFPFPKLGTQWDSEGALDMPVDGFAITTNAPTAAADQDAARAFLEFVASGSTQVAFGRDQVGTVAVAKDADTSGYNDIQKKVVAMIRSANRVVEFFDRDTEPAFSYAAEVEVQGFLGDPDRDLDALLTAIQDHWDHR